MGDIVLKIGKDSTGKVYEYQLLAKENCVLSSSGYESPEEITEELSFLSAMLHEALDNVELE